MNVAHAPSSRERSNPSRAIVLGGLIAGVLDITAAIVSGRLRGAAPSRVLQSVASGLLGKAAFDGGAATALLGLLLHFAIAFGAAAVFVLLSRRFKFLVERPWLTGPVYGLAVYFVMYRAVMPLSAVPWKTPAITVKDLAIHVFCVGLPIALAARRFSRR